MMETTVLVTDQNGGMKASRLSEEEKRFTAIAIQGLMMRQGPATFSLGMSIAVKLGVDDLIDEYLASWIRSASTRELEAWDHYLSGQPSIEGSRG